MQKRAFCITPSIRFIHKNVYTPDGDMKEKEYVRTDTYKQCAIKLPSRPDIRPEKSESFSACISLIHSGDLILPSETSPL